MYFGGCCDVCICSATEICETILTSFCSNNSKQAGLIKRKGLLDDECLVLQSWFIRCYLQVLLPNINGYDQD